MISIAAVAKTVLASCGSRVPNGSNLAVEIRGQPAAKACAEFCQGRVPRRAFTIGKSRKQNGRIK